MAGGEFVVLFAPDAARQKVTRWKGMLRQRIISMIISVAIGGAVWYFFRDQVGAFGPWLVGSAAVIGLGWIVFSVSGLLIARREVAGVGDGPAFAVTRQGVWIVGNWLPWPNVAALRAAPGSWGRSPQLVVQGRDGGSVQVPMDYLDALPATIDSAVRALSGGRSWIDLSRLDD